jgi:hypothetical protein
MTVEEKEKLIQELSNYAERLKTDKVEAQRFNDLVKDRIGISEIAKKIDTDILKELSEKQLKTRGYPIKEK